MIKNSLVSSVATRSKTKVFRETANETEFHPSYCCLTEHSVDSSVTHRGAQGCDYSTDAVLINVRIDPKRPDPPSESCNLKSWNYIPNFFQ